MRGWFDRGRILLGAALLGSSLAGCAAQHDEALRLSEELGRARADAAAQQARNAALEARMSRLEQSSALASTDRHADNRELTTRLDRLVELNAKLLATQTPPVASSEPNACPAPTPSPSSALSDEEQLRALVERMRGQPGRPHGGLSREQEAALQVLTRPERKLDTDALWPAAFY